MKSKNDMMQSSNDMMQRLIDVMQQEIKLMHQTNGVLKHNNDLFILFGVDSILEKQQLFFPLFLLCYYKWL